MSTLRSGDEVLHCSDSSHRWLAPDPADDATWTLTVRAHLDAHRANTGGQHVSSRVAGPETPSYLDRRSLA